MAPTQFFFILVAILMLLSSTLVESRPDLESKMVTRDRFLAGKPAAMECGGACKVRCSESSRPNLCERACGTCCSRCNCVPAGTNGNYQMCPCYATMTTRDGERKCP